METRQTAFWSGNFGKEYTDRNPQNSEEWDQFYVNNWGVSRYQMNEEFLSAIDKDSKILEVGCNIGLQLLGLQKMGFKNLYGVELQQYAVEKAKSQTKGINIIQGSGFDIPFKDEYFDLVYTSGVLIHIAPSDLGTIIKEMVRCSKKWIWGFEYYDEQLREVNYRGNEGFLWKADYASIFREQFPALTLKKQKLYPYITEGQQANKDVMYLLEK